MKKYYLFLLVAFGVLLMPHFSLAAIINTTGIATSSDINFMEDLNTGAAFYASSTSFDIPSGTTLYYEYYNGTTFSGATSFVSPTLYANGGAIFSQGLSGATTTPGALITGSFVTSADMPIGTNLLFGGPHGSATGNYDIAGEITYSTSSCGYGSCTWYYQPWFYLDTTPRNDDCDNPVSVSLAEPVPSSTIYNNFAAWTIDTHGLSEGCGYSLIMTYIPDIGSLTSGVDRTTVNTSPTDVPSAVTLTKSVNLWNYYNATTTKINYVAQLINNDDGVTVGANIGSFFFSYSASSSPLTAPPGFNPDRQCGGICQGFGTIGGGSIATPSTTIAVNGAECVPASGLTDIGGGISYGFCTTINYLFIPNSSTQDILNGDINILEGVPPFSWFFRTNAQIAALANGDTSYLTPGGSAVYTIHPTASTTPNNGVAFTILTGIGTATNTFTLLPANLTSNSFLTDGRLVDDYYNLILTFCICLAIIMVYKIAL